MLKPFPRGALVAGYFRTGEVLVQGDEPSSEVPVAAWAAVAELTSTGFIRVQQYLGCADFEDDYELLLHPKQVRGLIGQLEQALDAYSKEGGSGSRSPAELFEKEIRLRRARPKAKPTRRKPSRPR